jgi:hypothetical protein
VETVEVQKRKRMLESQQQLNEVEKMKEDKEAAAVEQ